MNIDDRLFMVGANLHAACASAHKKLVAAMDKDDVLVLILYPVQHVVFVWATAAFLLTQMAHQRRMSRYGSQQ